MSYGIMPYMVDLKSIEDIFGTNNIEVKEKIISKSNEFSKDMMMQFGEDTNSLIKSFLDGKISNDSPYLIWYFIEFLIKKDGRMLDNEFWCPANIDELYEINELKIFDINIPGLNNPDDFPTVFVCRNEKISSLMGEVMAKISDKNMRGEFLFWILLCNQYDKDLVLYYY